MHRAVAMWFDKLRYLHQWAGGETGVPNEMTGDLIFVLYCGKLKLDSKPVLYYGTDVTFQFHEEL